MREKTVQTEVMALEVRLKDSSAVRAQGLGLLVPGGLVVVAPLDTLSKGASGGVRVIVEFPPAQRLIAQLRG